VSFANQGLGLAAAGSDVLVWNGSGWLPSGLLPPEGKDWVRVAATDARDASTGASTSGTASGTGWAIAGVPRWPTYVDAEPPAFFDGASWSSADVDYLGMQAMFEPSEVDATPRPFVALAADGSRAWALSRITVPDVLPGAEDAKGTAALLELDTGRARFAHPLVIDATDVAASPAAAWVAGVGAPGLLQRDRQWTWSGSRAMRFVSDLDIASPASGWALGNAGDGVSGGGDLATDASWRWFAGRWAGFRLPSGMAIRAIRALPDGRAWGVTADGDLVAHDGDTGWHLIDGAPRARVSTEWLGVGGAPFDVIEEGGNLVAWVAGTDGMYRYENGTFTLVPDRLDFRVRDLQLVNSRFGWAIGVELSGRVPEPVLLHLIDRQWWVVPPTALGIRSAQWVRLSVASPGEVWLLGTLRPVGSGVAQQSLVRYNGAWTVFGREPEDGTQSSWPLCDAAGLAAAPRSDGGTDVWLVGAAHPCGPSTWQTTEDAPSPPVSRLEVHPVRTQSYLPMAITVAP
jgi:hypothetical protein